jgi:hypothetical protein
MGYSIFGMLCPLTHIACLIQPGLALREIARRGCVHARYPHEIEEKERLTSVSRFCPASVVHICSPSRKCVMLFKTLYL